MQAYVAVSPVRDAQLALTNYAVRLPAAGEPRTHPIIFLKLLTALLIALALMASPVDAGTLGQITDINFGPDTVSVDGEPLRVVAESRIFEVSGESGESSVASLRSLQVGDYVIVERDGEILKSATRIQPVSSDIPPGGLVPRVLQEARPE